MNHKMSHYLDLKRVLQIIQNINEQFSYNNINIYKRSTYSHSGNSNK